jgi:Protein of unknown function (DUF2892)
MIQHRDRSSDMTRNLGDADRTARAFAGMILFYVFFRRLLSGPAQIVLALISVYLLGTAVLGWCPAYALMKKSTISADDFRGETED